MPAKCGCGQCALCKARKKYHSRSAYRKKWRMLRTHALQFAPIERGCCCGKCPTCRMEARENEKFEKGWKKFEKQVAAYYNPDLREYRTMTGTPSGEAWLNGPKV